MSRTSSPLESRIIRAGAGAGKTTRLISEVQSFAESFYSREGRWPRLVLTTFTIKATQELKERLFLKATQEAAYAEGKRSHAFTEFVLSPQNLMITTIHGALAQFLRKNAEVIGWDPQFRFVDEAEDLRTAKTLLAQIVFAEESEFTDLTEELNFSSLLPLMFLYARTAWTQPGFAPISTKTFESLAEQGRAELRKLCSTFISEAGHQELSENWQILLGKVSDIEQQAASTLPWKEFWSFIASDELDLKKPRASKKSPNPPELEVFLEKILSQLKELSTEIWSPAHWTRIENNMVRIEHLGRTFTEQFWELKKTSASLALGDLEPLAFRLAHDSPESAKKFAADWDYWLIDEYQDTSPLQNKLIDLFTQATQVFYVGDPQQSIYYFRGARSEVFNARFDSAETRGLLQEELLKNYRSKPSLMRFFNAFFQAGPSPFKPLEPGRPENTDTTEMDAVFFQCKDAEEETRASVHHILGLIETGAELDSIAVIARTNDDLNRIALLLTQQNVPTHVHASSQFAIRREILDLRAVCAFLINPKDDEAAVTVLRTPWFYLEDTVIAKTVQERHALNYALRKSLWEHLGNSDRPQIHRLKSYVQKAQIQGLSATIAEVLRDTGIVDVSHVYDSTGQRESNLWKFVLLLKEAEHSPGFSAVEFLHQWNRERTALAEEGDAVAALEPNRINLMTIHASKGLQFDHVVVPYLSRAPRLSNSNFFEMDPSGAWCVKARGEDGDLVGSPFHLQMLAERRNAELQESDRLLYVAATRAKLSIAFTLLSEAKENSWHKRFRWNYELGAHDRSSEGGFRYQVLESTIEALPPKPVQSKRTPTSEVVRPPFPSSTSKDRLTRRSASSISADSEGRTEVRSGSLPKGFILSPVKGILFHQKMERLQKHFVRYGGEIDATLASDPEIRWVLSLSEVPMKAILGAGSAEWPFQIVNGTDLIIGQIDLWGEVQSELSSELWVLDYKTGSSKNMQKGLDQLQIYGWALSKFKPDQVIRLAALFPGEQKVFATTFDSSRAQELLASKPSSQGHSHLSFPKSDDLEP